MDEHLWVISGQEGSRRDSDGFLKPDLKVGHDQGLILSHTSIKQPVSRCSTEKGLNGMWVVRFWPRAKLFLSLFFSVDWQEPPQLWDRWAMLWLEVQMFWWMCHRVLPKFGFKTLLSWTSKWKGLRYLEVLGLQLKSATFKASSVICWELGALCPFFVLAYKKVFLFLQTLHPADVQR